MTRDSLSKPLIKVNSSIPLTEPRNRIFEPGLTVFTCENTKCPSYNGSAANESALCLLSNNRSRSNVWKLELKRFNTSQCGNFFTYKIAPIWNRLPAEAVNSASVEQFKIELDKVIDTLI